MTNKFEQLKNEASNIRMTESEKSLMKSRIQETMEHFPIREESASAKPVKSPFNFMLLARSVALVLVGFVGGGGGLAFAAEQSLPGDVLYPVKTEITEEVVSVLQTTPEAKIAWEEKRILKRADELVRLQTKGKLVEGRARVAADKIERSNKKMEAHVVQLSKDLSFNGVQFSPVNSSVTIMAADTTNSFRATEDLTETVSTNNRKPRRPVVNISTLGVAEVAPAVVSTEETKPVHPVLTPEDFGSRILGTMNSEIDRLTKNGILDDQGIKIINELMDKAEKLADQKATKEFFHTIREIKSILEKYILNS